MSDRNNENDGGTTQGSSEESTPSQTEAQRLEKLFEETDLPEITGVDFSTLSPKEIAELLPSYGSKHPLKGILIDKTSGKAYGIASGWDNEDVLHNDMPFRSGAIRPEIAAAAGPKWTRLGNHVEPVAAAFMRKMKITEAIVVINGRNPCWGNAEVPGCYFQMSFFLAENAKLTVYNKYGSDFVASRPDRKFHFTGEPD